MGRTALERRPVHIPDVLADPEYGWTEAQRAWIHDYFVNEVMPVLTPIGLDPSHPFPKVLNKSLNFIVELEGRDAFGRGSRVARADRRGAQQGLSRAAPARREPAQLELSGVQRTAGAAIHAVQALRRPPNVKGEP